MYNVFRQPSPSPLTLHDQAQSSPFPHRLRALSRKAWALVLFLGQTLYPLARHPVWFHQNLYLNIFAQYCTHMTTRRWIQSEISRKNGKNFKQFKTYYTAFLRAHKTLNSSRKHCHTAKESVAYANPCILQILASPNGFPFSSQAAGMIMRGMLPRFPAHIQPPM